MDNVKFEQMLSFHPKLPRKPATEICLRDMIYQYYLTYFPDGEADNLTTLYIAQLWERMK